MSVDYSSEAWIGYRLELDNQGDFFESETSLEELVAEELELSDDNEEDELENLMTEDGLFYDYLESLFPDADIMLMWGGHYWGGHGFFCGITLAGLSTDNDGEFEFTEQQKNQLKEIKKTLEEKGFKLGKLQLHCGMNVS